MGNNSKRKYVANGLLTVASFAIDDFWSHIAWCATSDEDIFRGISPRGKSVVSYYYIVGPDCSKDEVLRFEISVDNSLLVHFHESENEISEDFLNLVQLEAAIIQLFEELASLEVFDNEVERVIAFEDFEQLHEAWVIQGSHHVDLVH